MCRHRQQRQSLCRRQSRQQFGQYFRRNPSFGGWWQHSWLPAVNASANAAGEAVCECCPSQPFWTAGRYYDLVRNNNENIRDFWLMSSADGENWDAALDIDPLDWEINSCPESGATLAGPVVGTEYLTAFMSAGGPSGQSRVYVSSIDLEANGGAGEWLSTEPITVSQFDNATQNTPVLGQWQGADGTSIVALAWEQNAGGYDVQLALSAGMEWSLTDVAQNLTSEWSGQHRKPALAFSTDANGEPLLHLAWQHSSSGTVHYFKGGIQSPSGHHLFGPSRTRNHVGPQRHHRPNRQRLGRQRVWPLDRRWSHVAIRLLEEHRCRRWLWKHPLSSTAFARTCDFQPGACRWHTLGAANHPATLINSRTIRTVPLRRS